MGERPSIEARAKRAFAALVALLALTLAACVIGPKPDEPGTIGFDAGSPDANGGGDDGAVVATPSDATSDGGVPTGDSGTVPPGTPCGDAADDGDAADVAPDADAADAADAEETGDAAPTGCGDATTDAAADAASSG